MLPKADAYPTQPLERPERRRRANNTYRETVMNSTGPEETMPNMYQQATLPSLAPANSFSPAAPHDVAMLTSSFRVNSSTSQGAANRYPPQFPDSAYPQSSPMAVNQHLGLQYQSPTRHRAPSITSSNDFGSNGIGRSGPAVRPVHPEDPYNQFIGHMRPQLEADDYDSEQIPYKIQSEWDNLSAENRKLWEDRYNGQMTEYEAAMDAFKQARRNGAAAPPPPIA